jgi:hypothetical protein
MDVAQPNEMKSDLSKQ